jgi:hypothetical protein
MDAVAASVIFSSPRRERRLLIETANEIRLEPPLGVWYCKAIQRKIASSSHTNLLIGRSLAVKKIAKISAISITASDPDGHFRFGV